jgi:hypothetical protein
MRRSVSIVLASLLLLLLAVPAGAQTPLDERRVRTDLALGDLDATVSAELGCGFDVLVEDIAGTITYVFITEDRHGNVLERLIWHTTTRLTNTETGAWVDFRFDSVQNITIRADGSLKLITRNDGIFWGGDSDELPPGPGLYFIDHGRVVDEIAPDGTILSEVVQEADAIIDLCAMLD